jgi:hypothetical protein
MIFEKDVFGRHPEGLLDVNCQGARKVATELAPLIAPLLEKHRNPSRS